MYEHYKTQIAHITLFKTKNWIKDLKLKLENSACKMTRSKQHNTKENNDGLKFHGHR